MAIYTAQASGQVLTGTDNPDLFILSAATSLAIFGQGGSDTVNGYERTGSLYRSFVTLAGGPDQAIFTGNISGSTIRMGAGGDVLTVSGGIGDAVDSSKIFAGDGSDTIQIFETSHNSEYQLGAGADSMWHSADFESSKIFAGAGADTIQVLDDVTASTVGLGGGADSMFISGDLDNSKLAAGAGSDTVTIDGTASGSTIQLGGNADKLFLSAVASSTINGGAGGDTIVIDGTAASSRIFGDAGSDSIYVKSGSNSSLIDGGDGADTIYAGVSGFNVIGGEGGDLLQFQQSSDVNLKYTQASESNYLVRDTVQVINQGFGATASAWVAVSAYMPQEVKVASGIIGPNFNTDNSGRVTTFKGGVGPTLEDRVTVLNQDLDPGQSVLFEAEGNQYFFMAGNNLGAIDDDLVIQAADNTNVAGIDTAGNSRLRLRFYIT